MHGVKGQWKRAVVEELARVDLAGRMAEVVRRLHGQRRMDGLGVHDGWSCKIGVCTAVSTKGSAIGQHCRQAHGLQVKTGGVVSGVRLQTVFGEKARYFVVTVVEVVSRAGRRGVRVAQAAAWPGAPRHGPDVGHVSSVRRWLRWGSRRATSYPGRPRGGGAGSYLRQRRSGAAGGGLQRLDSGAEWRQHRVDRQLLNSFQYHVRSQERLQRLQNGDRVAGYRAGVSKGCLVLRGRGRRV